MKKVALLTLGCRVNIYETEAIAESFVNNGYQIVEFDQYADVYVINTCSVTNIGDKKSRQMIRKAKKTNPAATVVAAGCYAQVSPEEVSRIDGVDIVVGTSDKNKIVELVNNFEKDRRKITHIKNIMDIREFEEMEINEYQDRTRAFLKIQDGCDRYCSYCLIPYARGPVRSRNKENIYNEVLKLAENGYKEIVLSGIHVASYGKDLEHADLMEIIKMVNDINGIERIRIGSIDPTFFTEEVIGELKAINKFCPHFHLSLQSGCNDTLKRMNRHYTTELYKEIVLRLRKAFEDVSITTDIIVGFPGETEQEFQKTYQFLKEIKLSKMHVFKYSPRSGTRAARMENQVSPEIKEARSNLIIELDKVLESEYIEKFTGRNMDVLFEENERGVARGYTLNYIKVQCHTEEDITGRILPVKLVCNLGEAVSGNLLETN